VRGAGRGKMKASTGRNKDLRRYPSYVSMYVTTNKHAMQTIREHSTTTAITEKTTFNDEIYIYSC
jgi:hypothetical protein